MILRMAAIILLVGLTVALAVTWDFPAPRECSAVTVSCYR